MLWLTILGCTRTPPGPETLVGGTEDTGEAQGTGDTGDAGETGETGETDVKDSAVVVSADLPTALSCGETYAASVEMRNAGTATWTRDGAYKLGAVDDEDDLYGPDTRVWLAEGVSVAPGQTHTFEFTLTAPTTEASYHTDWQMVHEEVRWFGETTTETVTVTCGVQTVCDPLTDSSLQSGFANKDIAGGSFSTAGWQTTSANDQILLELTAPVTGDGHFSINVTNFDPTTQYAETKHQIINMYTTDDGTQGVFKTDEAWWNIRTGTNYGTGMKLLAAPNGGDSREEVRLIEGATWDPSDVHTITVAWDDADIDMTLDGTLLTSLGFAGRVQPLQHIFIGKDNVYDGQIGPIYSNLCVTW